MAVQSRTMIGTLQDRVGDEELLRRTSDQAPSKYNNGMWGRLIYHHAEYQADPIGIYGRGAAYDSNLWAGQLGFDVYRATTTEGSRDHAGFYGGYGQVDAEVDHNVLDRQFVGGTVKETSYSLGVYWTHFSPTGAYLDAVAQVSWHEFDLNARRLEPASPNGKSYAVSLEGGYPVDIGKIRIEPQAQLVYQHFTIDSFSDGFATVRYRDLDSLAGRAGLRVATTGPVSVWVRANLWYEFMGKPRTEISSDNGFVSFRAELPELSGQFGGGFTVPVAPRIVLYGSANYDTTFDGKGSGYDAKIGFRINW